VIPCSNHYQGAKGCPCAVAVACSNLVGLRDELQDVVGCRILRLLGQNSEMSERNLGRVVGIITGIVHSVLKGLVDKGLVQLTNFTASEDKWHYAHVLTPRGISEQMALSHQFLERKITKDRALRAEIKEVSGDMWVEEVAEFAASAEKMRFLIQCFEELSHSEYGTWVL
jgi:EPS-associated MarR family transcriptional regulator